MRPRAVRRAALTSAVPSLIEAKHSVVVTATRTGQFAAAGVAWELAREVARRDQRVALIDLGLETPSLDRQADNTRESGIVDAFLFGASLQHVAVPQQPSGLFYIGVGTSPANPVDVWQSPRWQRLARGFTKELAVMILWVPPEALDHLRLTPDLLVVVSQAEATEQLPMPQHYREEGVAIAQVVLEPSDAPAEQLAARPQSGDRPPTRPAVSQRKRNRFTGLVPVMAVVGSIVVAVIATLVVRPWSEQGPTAPDTPAGQTGPPAVAGSGDPDAQPPPEPRETQRPPTAQSPESLAARIPTAPPPSTTAADSLYYSVQVAAWSRFDNAREHISRFNRAGFVATLSAVRQGPQRVWYRVVVGAAPTAREGATIREALWDRGLLPRASGILLRTPFTLQLGERLDSASATGMLEGLRETGIPAYILWMLDGSVRIVTGAFETPDQARLTDSVLPAGSPGGSRTLIPRSGRTR